MAKTVVQIPLGPLDTFSSADSAPSGTWRELENVVRRHGGELARRAPFVGLPETSSPAPSITPEIIDEWSDGCPIVLGSDTARVFDSVTSGWTYVSGGANTYGTAAASTATNYDVQRVSVRSDMFQSTPELASANTDVIDSVIAGGYLYTIWTDESPSLLATHVYISAYEVTADGTVGACILNQYDLYADLTAQISLPGTIDGVCRARLCKRTVSGVQQVVIGLLVHDDAANWDLALFASTANAGPVFTLYSVLTGGSKSIEADEGPWYDITEHGVGTTTKVVLAVRCVDAEVAVAFMPSTVAALSFVTVCAAGYGVSWCSSHATTAATLSSSRGLLVVGNANEGGHSEVNGLNYYAIDLSGAAPSVLAGTGDQIEIDPTIVDAGNSTGIWKFTGAEVGISGGRCVTTRVWWSYGDPALRPTRTYSCVLTTGSATVSEWTVRYGVTPISRPVPRGTVGSSDEKWSVWCRYLGNQVAAVNLPQTAHILLSDMCDPIAICHRDIAYTTSFAGVYLLMGQGYGSGNALPVMPFGGAFLTNASYVTGTNGQTIGIVVATVSTGTTTSSGAPAMDGTAACVLRSDMHPRLSYVASRPSRFRRQLLIPGGTIRRYDGQTSRNAFWALRPEALNATSNSDGSLSSGTYAVSLVYTATNSDGTTHVSAPSAASNVALDGSSTTAIDVIAQCDNLSLESRTNVEVYCDDGAGGPQRLSYTSYVPTGGQMQKALTTITSVPSASNATLPNYDGSLENDPGVPADILCVWKNRLWLAGCENRHEIRYSKPLDTGYGFELSDAQTMSVLNDTSDVTALCAWLDRMFIFKENSIYTVGGDGPDATGVGTFTDPQPVALGTGTRYPASVVSIRDGVCYVDQTGVKLIDGGFNVKDIGAPIIGFLEDQGWDRSAAPVIPVAAPLQREGSVAFLFKGTKTWVLVWSYLNNSWTTWSLPSELSSATTVWLSAQNRDLWVCGDTHVIKYNMATSDPIEGGTLAGNQIVTKLRTNRIFPSGYGGYESLSEIVVHGRCNVYTGGECVEGLPLWAGMPTSMAPSIQCTVRSDCDGRELISATRSVSVMQKGESIQYRLIPASNMTNGTWFDLELSVSALKGEFVVTGITASVTPAGGGPRMGTTQHFI